MPLVEESVVIARPPQEVFEFLAKFENLSVYDAFVTASGQVGDGPSGLGTRGWGTTRFMGQQSDWTVEYTEFEPPRPNGFPLSRRRSRHYCVVHVGTGQQRHPRHGAA